MVYYLLLTEECNLTCRHCIRGEKHSIYLSIDKIEYILDILKKHAPDAHLVLTGGEPTLHPDFIKIAEKATSIFHSRVAVTTNGCSSFWLNATPDIVKRLRIQISLDGEKCAHEQLRGKGTFDLTIKTITRLVQASFNVSIATVVSLQNRLGVLLLAQEIARLRPSHWTISPYLPYGFHNLDGYEISVFEWNQFVDKILRMRIDSVPIHIKKLYDTRHLENLSEEQLTIFADHMMRCNLRNCGVITAKLYIYPDLTVFGCTCLKKYPLGNLRYQTLDDILTSPNALLVKQAKLSDDAKCNRCKYVKVCNGGCLGMSVHCFSEIGHGDSRCPIWRQL